MIKAYTKKHSLEFAQCSFCEFWHETPMGEFDTETEAIELAETLHEESKAQTECVKMKLRIKVGQAFLGE